MIHRNNYEEDLNQLTLNIPLSDANISILGRPRSSKGINSNRTTRPVPSFAGFAPTSAKAIAIDSPIKKIR